MEPTGAAHQVAPRCDLNSPFAESEMNSIRIYPGRDGWFYEVWFDSRIVVFGWCASRERAASQAATA